MSELRHDPLTDRWVVISPERAGRPRDVPQSDKSKLTFCPFCPGNEDKTPTPEIFAVLENGSTRRDTVDPEQIRSDWRLRVIPNKFTALRLEDPLRRRGDGLYDKVGGFGAHEIVVEGRDHQCEIDSLPLEQVILILNILKLRMTDLEKDPRFRYLSVFKNKGNNAGASLEHPHFQLIGLPITPSEVARELRCSMEHYLEKDRCLICDILLQEMEKGERIIDGDESFVVLSPYAARFSGEIFIAPSPDEHSHSFPETDIRKIEKLAVILQRTLLRLKRKYNDPPYNIALHTAPFFNRKTDSNGESIKQDFHWHIHIFPRIHNIAGFELSNDCYINTYSPEAVAETLRGAEV
jgi:UDPglucose--hexose-1-phosphate uridylyltransferase